MLSRSLVRTRVVPMTAPESDRCRLLVQMLFGDTSDGGVQDFAAG